jgi:hypothetical protein
MVDSGAGIEFATVSSPGIGTDAVGFEREVGGPDCDVRAVLVLAMVLGWTVMKGLDFGGPLVVRSGGILMLLISLFVWCFVEGWCADSFALPEQV